MENKRPFKGFIGASYVDNDPRFDAQDTVNYYTQMTQSGSSLQNQIVEFLQRPGLRKLQGLGLTIRPGGMYTLSNNDGAIIVAGNQVYFITAGASLATNIVGSMGTSSGAVSISDNGGYVVIVDGTTSYYTFQVGTTTLETKTDPNYPGASMVTYQDGFWFFTQPGSPNVFTSENAAPQGGTGGGPVTFGTNNIAVKQGYSDFMVGAISNAREVFLFGTQTGEVWADTGTQIYQPFTREDGKNAHVGCFSAATICQLAGTVFFLGRNPQGGAIVYYMNGYVPTRVSTHAVEQQLLSLGDLSQAYAYGVQWEGHYFYVLQCPGNDFTWVYDVSGISDQNPNPGNWVKWKTTQSNNLQGQFAGVAHCYLNDQHLFGDINGNILLFDKSACTDNGAMIVRQRTSNHWADNQNEVFYHLLQVVFTSGQGLVNNGVNTANAVNPRAILEYSNDGAQTWSQPLYAPLGAIGKYKTRARWQRLGHSRDRVFRVTVTDPVIAHMVLAELDYEVGNA